MWLTVDQKTNTIKTHYLKETRLRLQILSTTPHSTLDTIGKTYVFDPGSSTNVHFGIRVAYRNEIKGNPTFVDASL